VLVDGARQDFQRSGHFANGQFYIDPEFLGGVDVVRGPVANVYGSGAIGGVASFRTKELSDIILPGEIAAGQSHGMFGTKAVNGSRRPSRARAVRPAIFLPAASIATA
jgi:hemoglobin/transferrin/lactoferrin receptor protein